MIDSTLFHRICQITVDCFLSIDYLWYLTIVISFLTIILILSIVCETKHFFANPSLSQNLFFQSTTTFFLHYLFNHRDFIDDLQKIFNRLLSERTENVSIEAVHFAHARIDQVSQDKADPTVKKLGIYARLDLDHLIFNLLNPIKGQHYSIEIGKFSAHFRIDLLIDNDERYRMKIHFQKIHLERMEIIDPHNILSTNEKQSIIKLLEETICQSVVPCSFHLTANEENSISESPVPVQTTPVVSVIPETVLPSPPPAPDHQNSVEISPIIPSLNSSMKKFSVRIVKAVKLHDVEQPFCVLQLNHPKQIHQTSLAKNGLNPFWDERFLFQCDEQTNQLRLQIFDRRKTSKKQTVDRLYTDLSIPFAYVTSSSCKQDIRITPQYPDSILRIEFSTLIDDNEQIDSTNTNSPSDVQLNLIENNKSDYPSLVPLPHQINDRISTSTREDDEESTTKPSLLCSLKHFRLSSKKKRRPETPTDLEPVPATKTRLFRNFFRSKSKKTNTSINTGNFILDHPDLLATSTPVSKKRSFFQRKPKKSATTNFSANSLNSNDCSRSESVRNMPIRANGGRPVTMNKANGQ